MTDIDLEDVQSLIVRPSKASRVEIHFLRFRDRAGMRLFLQRGAAQVTTATEMTAAIDVIKAQRNQPEPPSTVSIAVSVAGLDLAGIDPRARSALSPAFVEGMSTAADRLGDVGDSDPQWWEAPFNNVAGIGGPAPVHAAVIVHGTMTGGQNDAFAAWLKVDDGPLPDCVTWIGAGRNGFEPFGFKDSISDPVIGGSGKTITPGNGVWDPALGGWRAVKAGEALLGYVDESDALAGHPDAAHIERNGSYLVLRKLEQHVERFWQECANWAEDLWPAQPDVDADGTAVGSTDDAELADGAMGYPDGDGDGDGDAPNPLADPSWPVAVAARTTNAGKVAAQLVGRTWNGAILRQPEKVDVPDGDPTNDFLYRDPAKSDGITVAPSAHIRRANPRDGIGAAHDLVRRHLLFRRGIPYYEPNETKTVDGVKVPGPSRGLLFMACCADLRRQFEFIQSRWLQDGSRFGLGRERDPLTGTRDGAADIDIDDKVSIDHDGSRCRQALATFVTMRGGEYFLLPSRSALLLLGDPTRTD